MAALNAQHRPDVMYMIFEALATRASIKFCSSSQTLAALSFIWHLATLKCLACQWHLWGPVQGHHIMELKV